MNSVRDPRLDAITADYLDEPCARVDGPASSVLTHDEMVNLEGGPAGDLGAPRSHLEQIGDAAYAFRWQDQVLLYRPIGVESDRPRIFAFDGYALRPESIE